MGNCLSLRNNHFPAPGRAMPGEKEEAMAKGIEMSFPTVSALRSWLKEKNFWSDSAEEYDEWLQEFCQNNTITVTEKNGITGTVGN